MPYMKTLESLVRKFVEGYPQDAAKALVVKRRLPWLYVNLLTAFAAAV